MKIKEVVNCKRISILGVCGSGKSTLAQRLGSILGLPVHHIDSIYYKENWEKIDREEVAEKVRQISKQEKWILDGNYTLTLANRFKRSDLVIFLNFPIDFCIESFKNRENQIGLPDCLRGIKPDMDYIITYMQRFPTKVKPTIDILAKKYKGKVIEFATREHVNQFLEELKVYLNL